MCPRTGDSHQKISPHINEVGRWNYFPTKSNFSELKIGPRIYATVQKQIAMSRKKHL